MKLVTPKRGGTEEPATKVITTKTPLSFQQEVNDFAVRDGYKLSRFTFHLLRLGLDQYKKITKRAA